MNHLREFPHMVVRKTGLSLEQKMWCQEQFGPSSASLVRYSLGITPAGLRIGLYDGEGRWAFSITSVNFEHAEDAFAFKIRWG